MLDHILHTFTGVSPGKFTVKGYTKFGEVEFTLVVLPLANGAYYVKNLFSNRYMNILDATGTLIGDLETNSANASKWIFTHHAKGYYTIKLANLSSNYYFGVKNDSTVLGTEMVLRSGTVTAGMLWKIEVTSSGDTNLLLSLAKVQEWH